MANLSGLITVFLFSQTAWIVLYVAGNIPNLTMPQVVLSFGTVSLFVVVCCLRKILPPFPMKTKTSNPNVLSRGFVYYTCCMFSWSCIIDLAFFFEVVGIVKDVMRFYLETGEPYFDTSFGALILLSDVLINYPLLLYIIYQIDNKLDCRNAVMFWGGTAVTNLVCLIGGALFGEYRHNMYPASFLNIPYTVIPVYVTCKFLLQPRNFEYQKARSNSRRPILFSFFLAIGMIAVIVLGIVRGLAAFRFPATFATYYATNVEPYVMDPAGFGAVWPMYFMFAGTFILVPMLYGLFHKGTEWMIDWSFIFAGVAINGSYVQLAQFLPGVEGQYHPPDAKLALFINVFIPMLSVILLVHCINTSEYFGKGFKKIS